MSDKVTLIFPRLRRESNVWAPLPLMAVAAPLLAEGFEIELLDPRTFHPHIPEILQAAGGSLFVGLSVMTGFQIRDAVIISKALKDVYPEMPVVWGGYHASMLPEQTLAEDYVDMVIRGQGQPTALELARRLAAGEDLEGVPGLCYKRDGEAIVAEHPPLVEIDQYPSTPYDILDIETYMVPDLGTRTMKYFSSQGCPFGCGFCAETSMYGRGWVGFPPERVLDDLENLAKNYGVNAIDFADTNFFVSKKRVKAICEGILERGLDLKWAADVRTRQFIDFSPRFRELIRDAGCRRLLLGAESGSQEALKMIGKQTTVDDTLHVARLCDGLGITARFTTMFGFPGEPEKDIELTLRMIEGIKAVNEDFEVHGFFFAPYPGAPMYEEAVQLGFRPPGWLEGWADFDLTELHTPWVNPEYKKKVDMIIDFYMPYASPGPELRQKMAAGGPRSYAYRAMHRLASWRVGNRNFEAPLEWKLKQLKAGRRG
ncbi:MAG: B12-binding domain-containing radical SAM protein [Thermoleophilia bacterium]|nr:B12-binding domain-containing radical SAM protein [Thermoleophilia bacterium]